MTEFGLAADLAQAVHGIGATPSVVLVAGAERGGVQHPIPTSAPLGRRALAVVTAVRHGLHVSFSRWVRFAGTEPSAVETLREVEAEVFAATRPGRALSAVVANIATAYERHGLGSLSILPGSRTTRAARPAIWVATPRRTRTAPISSPPAARSRGIRGCHTRSSRTPSSSTRPAH
ncbi:hypothetical protein [Microbacterium suwonense]|nr:hypothetical protein [Microbacterium suwonense]